MNTSLTPTDTVGRMLHTFNCTAYEIDDCTYQNMGEYGFISGTTVLNNSPRLRFRSIYLRDLYKLSLEDNSPYTADENGYIEILINPNGNYGKILAQSIHIEDCQYGDKFKINNNVITIGATQSYNLDNLIEIQSVKFNPAEVIALTASDFNPLITYSYYDTFSGVSLFDNIVNISVNSVPARQFMGVIDKNIIKEIEDAKTKVLKYDRIILEQRPVEEIYSIIDLDDREHNAAWVDMFLGQGFSEEMTINQLFTFDRTGWGRGRNTMEGKMIRANTNIVSDDRRPADILKNMPFYIFHVLPTTIPSSVAVRELRTYRSQIILAFEKRSLTITDNELVNKEEEELINSLSNITTAEKTAIKEFKRLLINYPFTLGSYVADTNYEYVLTTDETRDENKIYYLKQFSDEDRTVYTVYQGDLREDLDIYEYKLTSVPIGPELKDLYLNLDYDKFTYDKDYYFIYENGVFKLLDSGEYSTKVYFNTGYEDGLPTTDEELKALESCTVDVGNSMQPIIYRDIDELTDMYIGNGVIATLGYQYSTTDYNFEDTVGSEIYILKTAYKNAVARYEAVREKYSHEDLENGVIDPTRQIANNGAREIDATWAEWIHTTYKLYVSKIAEYIKQ